MDDSTGPPIELAGGSDRDLHASRTRRIDELGREISRDEQLANLGWTRPQEGRDGMRPARDVGSVSRSLWRMFYSLPSVG
jgi:hypothetical protein